MAKHEAVEFGGEIVAAQVRDEAKEEFYASDVWDHEFCADGDVCGDECIYEAE